MKAANLPIQHGIEHAALRSGGDEDELMRPFQYRTPRFLLSAQLHFQTEAGAVPGVCTDVSLGGVRARMEQNAPEVGKSGCLVLRYPGRQFTLGAVVSHLECEEVGFAFVERNRKEQLAAKSFAAFLETQAPPSVVLPPP